MRTTAATAHSSDADTQKAAIAVAEEARARLKGSEPTFGFLFASPGYDLGLALEQVRRSAPSAQVVGASTAGEFTEAGLSRDGLVLMLVASKDMAVLAELVVGVTADHEQAAAKACQRFGEKSRASYAEGWKRSTSVVLVDGLCGLGDGFVEAVRERTQPFQQIVGGAAGDGGAFEQTSVGLNGASATDGAAVMHVFGKKSWGVGVGHGLRPISDAMRVTRAEGNVVHEIDGQPAFEAYVQHARRSGVELTRDNAPEYMIAHELGVLFVDEIRYARAPLSVGEDGSLTCAADVAPGSRVCILDGEPDAMVRASRAAAKEAASNLGGADAAAVIVFDCVCRGMILGDQFDREIEGIRSVFGLVPVVGFLTYGEIARYTGKLHGWHNTTAVVAAIPA